MSNEFETICVPEALNWDKISEYWEEICCKKFFSLRRSQTLSKFTPNFIVSIVL
jgi:hypothetical protein